MSNITYKLQKHGGVLRSDGACIPATMENRHWREYQKWLSEGNTPSPEFTEQETIDKAKSEEIAELKKDLRDALVFQFRLIHELFRLLKANTSATNADVKPELLAKAIQWKQKTDRLKDIDE